MVAVLSMSHFKRYQIPYVDIIQLRRGLNVLHFGNLTLTVAKLHRFLQNTFDMRKYASLQILKYGNKFFRFLRKFIYLLLLLFWKNKYLSYANIHNKFITVRLKSF